MGNKEKEYERDLLQAIYRAIDLGATCLQDVLKSIGEADPRQLQELYEKILADEGSGSGNHPSRRDIQDRELTARRLSAVFPLELPCSDPMRCQWWFSLDSVVSLSRKARELAFDAKACFLGAPTLGYFYANAYSSGCAILDADKDVVKSLDGLPGANVRLYDVDSDLDEDLKDAFGVVVMDPPWYPPTCRQFVMRGLEFVGERGHILCVLPGLLTRPGVTTERNELLAELVAGDVEIVSIESGSVSYRVPRFEKAAYRDVTGFSGRHWRRGDLLVLRKGRGSSAIEPRGPIGKVFEVFSRVPQKHRVFLDCSNPILDLHSEVNVVNKFGSAVSTRIAPLTSVTAWSTDRKGIALRSPQSWLPVLESWARSDTREETLNVYQHCFSDLDVSIFDTFSSCLGLYEAPEQPIHRRSPEDLEEARRSLLTEYSPQPSTRRYECGSDGFRLSFQRDRDRVLWSKALKSLADKTQLFPVDSDDQLRRRSSHSIEVMQLASTIATSFGLDRDLAEAGALAHDVGHTPFGHAGERALNEVLDEIEPRFGGFNHYEHGLDVVRWLETPYRSPGAGEIPGLNLTPETEECIIKHTYYRSGNSLGQSELLKRSKHRDVEDTYCHLEGQAVRIADKISYLISDLEDGIRMGSIHYDDLKNCRFFEYPPIDLTPSKDESLFDRFISQRGSMLRVLMEDVLQASDQRLRNCGTLLDVRNAEYYVIDHSDWMKDDVCEIWENLQAGILHKEPAVQRENMRAARMVRSLFLLYCVAPNLIEKSFRQSHEWLRSQEYIRTYIAKVGSEAIGIPKRLVAQHSVESSIGFLLRPQGDNYVIDTYNAVLAKDYVASLTDSRMRMEFSKHCVGI